MASQIMKHTELLTKVIGVLPSSVTNELWDLLIDAHGDAHALERVRDLHGEQHGFCKHCGNIHPCPTIKAMDGNHE